MGFDLGHAISSVSKLALRTKRRIDKKNEFTKKVYVSDSFSYFGNGTCGRPLKELDEINIQEADESFKKCKKDMLDVFMKEHDFIKYKTNAYIRLNSMGLLEYTPLYNFLKIK